MKFILIFCLFFGSFLGVNADIKIIDINNEYNYIKSDTKLEGNYSNISPGYLGNNSNISKSNVSNNTYLGFLGSNFSKIINNAVDTTSRLGYIGSEFNLEKKDVKNIVPIGFFGSYIGMTLDFGLDEKKSSGGDNNLPQCILQNSVSDIKYEIQNDGYRDYIKLSWDRSDEVEMVKVMKVSYPQKEYEILGDIDEFRDFDIKEGNNMYFVVSYNDCLDFSYSDIIKVDYKKQNDNPFLSLNDNIISFLNYEGDEIKLSCFIGEKKIIEKKLQDDYRYMIDEKYLTENFYCSVEFLENDKIIKSNIIYNNLYGSSMTIKEFLQFVYGKGFTNEEINKKYYYLLNNIDLDSNITYEKLSTFLINIYADLIIKNDKLSFKLLQNLGLINNDTISTKVVKYEDLIYFISIINSKNNFREDVLLNINTLFELNTKAVFNDFIEIYTINDQLDRLSKVQKEELISCFNFVSCDNYNYYYNFLNKVEKLIDNNEYKKLDIDINSKKEITWLEYSKIIFKIISKQEFYDKGYKVQEYNDFINILNEAIFYGEEIIDKKLDYFTYKGLNIELITNRELYTSIQYLTKNHLKTINKIYKNIVNKEKLLLILREYLEK